MVEVAPFTLAIRSVYPIHQPMANLIGVPFSPTSDRSVFRPSEPLTGLWGYEHLIKSLQV